MWVQNKITCIESKSIHQQWPEDSDFFLKFYRRGKIKQDLCREAIIVSLFLAIFAVCVFFPVSLGHSCPTETVTLWKTEFQYKNIWSKLPSIVRPCYITLFFSSFPIWFFYLLLIFQNKYLILNEPADQGFWFFFFCFPFPRISRTAQCYFWPRTRVKEVTLE